VADAVVPAVEALGVEPVEALHAGREQRLRRLHDEMEVVVQQHPGVQIPAETPDHVDEALLPPPTIEVVLHDRALLDAT
jgi:hemoglobin-like flavoprotein